MWDIVYYVLVFVAIIATISASYMIGKDAGYEQGLEDVNAIIKRTGSWTSGTRCIHGNEGAQIVQGRLRNRHCDACNSHPE